MRSWQDAIHAWLASEGPTFPLPQACACGISHGSLATSGGWVPMGPVWTSGIGGYIRLTTNDLGAKTRSFYQAFHVHIAVHEFKMLPSVDRKSRPVSLSLQPRLGVSSRNPCNHEGITQDVYKESIGEG